MEVIGTRASSAEIFIGRERASNPLYKQPIRSMDMPSLLAALVLAEGNGHTSTRSVLSNAELPGHHASKVWYPHTWDVSDCIL